MAAPQYAILRFAKYKGPEISGIEAHNERTKEKYASNPDIDPTRTHLNFHLIKPERKYRAESEKQIAEAGCRTRSDSVRVVEALITATPEFFKGKKRAEIKEFFNEALEFIKQNQAPETIISAVVHLDEKSPHMHLCFVPLTEDKRLCAKEILGNKKKLTQWQDKYWEHMVKKYPDLERGESASETGRDHIPTRVFKQMTRLTKQKEKLDAMLSDVKFTNYKDRTAQVMDFLDKYIPDVAAMETLMKKYQKCFTTAESEKKALKKKNDDLTAALEKSQQQSTQKISMKVDTSAIEQEIANYEKQLRQSYSIKSRLIEEIDTLDPDDKHYIKRKADLDDRLYKMYDKIEDTESLLIEARAKKTAIEAEKLTADNIYKVLIYFDKLYAVMDEQERRQLMESLISEIHIFEERKPNGQWLKSIKFKLPIIEEDMEISLDNDTQVETVALLRLEK
ncbi:MobV family relaxase [Phascolarctobacterium faecium]|nr:MobV family relaxase [Phascolarctobacterium faecium]MDM8108873.1 MobV family relaxase [Phascolarctobacterium faecium]